MTYTRYPVLYMHMRACECACSLVSDSGTTWTVACQAPLSMEFSRQDCCSGMPFPPQGIFLTQRSNPCLFLLWYWQMDPLHTAPPELTLHAQSSSDPSRKKSFLLAQSFFWHALDLVCWWDHECCRTVARAMAYNLLKYFLYSLFFLLEHLPFSLFFFFSLYFSLFPWFTYSSHEPSCGCPEAVSWGWVGGCVCVCVCARAHACSVVSDFVTPWTCSPPGSSVHGIFQARILEWVAISYTRAYSRPRDQTHVSCVSCIGRQILYHWATWADIQRQWKNPVAYRYGLHTSSRKNYTGANLSLKHCYLFISFPF